MDFWPSIGCHRALHCMACRQSLRIGTKFSNFIFFLLIWIKLVQPQCKQCAVVSLLKCRNRDSQRTTVAGHAGLTSVFLECCHFQNGLSMGDESSSSASSGATSVCSATSSVDPLHKKLRSISVGQKKPRFFVAQTFFVVLFAVVQFAHRLQALASHFPIIRAPSACEKIENSRKTVANRLLSLSERMKRCLSSLAFRFSASVTMGTATSGTKHWSKKTKKKKTSTCENHMCGRWLATLQTALTLPQIFNDLEQASHNTWYARVTVFCLHSLLQHANTTRVNAQLVAPTRTMHVPTAGLGQRLVLAILLAPLDDVGAFGTQTLIGHF